MACGEEEKSDDTSGSNDTATEDTGSVGTDNDGDGVTVEDGDCNDEDASIYPGAPEDFTDGIDQDCDGYADVGDANCDAQFTIVFKGADADGVADSSEEVNLDFCRKWSMTNTYEYDPDTPPELNSISLDLNATDDDDFQCQLRIDQSGVCGEGYYRMGVETGTTYYASMDCSGVSDENEAEFTFADGYLRLDTIDTGTESGSFSGDPLKTEIAGHLHVWGNGIDVEGNLRLESEQITIDSEENECQFIDVDVDEDGHVQRYFDGEDCDDQDPTSTTILEDIDCNGILDNEENCGNSAPVIEEVECINSGLQFYPDSGTHVPTFTIRLSVTDSDGDLSDYSLQIDYDQSLDGSLDSNHSNISIGGTLSNEYCSTNEGELGISMYLLGNEEPSTSTLYEWHIIVKDVQGNASNPTIIECRTPDENGEGEPSN